MPESDEVKELLTQIRDLQREQLANYQQVTQRSLELQQQAVTRQEQLGKLYKKVVLAGSILVLLLVLLLVYIIRRYL